MQGSWKHMVWSLAASIALGGGAANPGEAQSAGQGTIHTADGVELAYRKLGSGPAVVVPGGFLWGSALDTLARGHTLILYDMRNRGASTPVADAARLTIQDDVRDLEEVRRGLGLDRMDLVGASYLGLMVILYAREYPDRVGRIVQVDPVPRRWDTTYPPALMRQDQPIDPKGWEELQQMRAAPSGSVHQRRLCEKEWEVMRVRLVGRPEAAARLPDPCAYPNEWPDHLRAHFQASFGSVQMLDFPMDSVRRVLAPVLVIHGTWDRNAPYGSGRQWAMELPNARLVTIAGAAHAPWADHATEVLAAITGFLAGGWPAGAEQVARLDP